MNNFEFRNPTKLIFGKGKIAQLSKEIPAGTKILMTYGGGSIFKNGVYDQVKKALEGYEVVEFGGIEANPDYDTLIQAVAICKEQKIEMLLAVGGGSVIDGTKFIAAAAKYDGADAWELMSNNALATDVLPLATVLTLPATGSEMNNGAVISRRAINIKLPFFTPKSFPQFSILDPETIYSLPKKQVANGLVDTFIHTVEQYLTVDNKTLVMDRWAEGILQALVEVAPAVMADEKDYDSCSNFMLAATMALNGFIAMGAVEDWATHMIGHELTALHGLDHGLTLSIIYPGMLRVFRNEKHAKLLQYGERVWGITEGSEEERIDATIAKTESFFQSLGMQIKLSDHGIGESTIEEIVKRFTQRHWKLGEGGMVTPEKAAEVLRSVI